MPVCGDHWPVCAPLHWPWSRHQCTRVGMRCNHCPSVSTAQCHLPGTVAQPASALCSPGWARLGRLQLHSFEQFLHGLNAQNILLRIINNNTTRHGAGMCCDAECIISSSLCVCAQQRGHFYTSAVQSACLSVSQFLLWVC